MGNQTKLPWRDYDAGADCSIYPVETGTIFKLTNPKRLFNPRAQAKIEHLVFIWILWRGKPPQGWEKRRRQDAEITTFTLYVPILAGFQFYAVSKQQKLKLRTITKYLSSGYEIIGKRVMWNYQPKNARRFYSVVSNHLGFPVG